MQIARRQNDPEINQLLSFTQAIPQAIKPTSSPMPPQYQQAPSFISMPQASYSQYPAHQMMQQMRHDAPPQKTMLTKLAEKAVDTAADLVVGGVSAAAASDVAHRAASAYVGGVYLGEEIVGPSAAIMGGFVGGTVSSAAYNSLPSKETFQAIRQEVCP